MNNKKSKLHYAWYILAICILLNITVQSLVMQISALYIVPMYNDLQVPRSLLSLQSILMTIGAVVTAPIWGKAYKQKDARKLLPVCVTMTALCTIGRSFMPNIWCILFLSLIKGVFFTGSTLLPISILLTVWFKEKRGIAISAASIGTSIGGVIFSPIIERLISTYGWRGSDRLVGIMMLAIVVPCLIIFVRNRPSDKNILPYGSNNESKTVKTKSGEESVVGMTAAQARKSPILYIFLLAIFAMTFATGAALQIPAYLTDIGYGSASAAKAVSGYMAVGIFGKLILGSIVDKIGDKKGTIYICTMGIMAFICFIFAKQQMAYYGIIVFYGLASGITSVMPTLLTSKIFGNKDYGPIYGMVVSINRFGGGIGTLLVSLLFDITGDYSIIWPVCMICMVFTLFAILLCMKMSEKAIIAQPSE